MLWAFRFIRKLDIRGLRLNPPFDNFSNACTQGLESVRNFVVYCDSLITWEKDVIARLIHASVSQGSHGIWNFPILALKYPATRSLSRLTKSVAPTAGRELHPSEIKISWSLGWGRVIVLGFASAPCASLKMFMSSLFQTNNNLSRDSFPANFRLYSRSPPDALRFFNFRLYVSSPVF